MKSVSGPRIVLVTRRTVLESAVQRHGTTGQARFYYRMRQRSFTGLEDAHSRFLAAMSTVQQGIPADWRRTRIDRADLHQFPFAPDDVVVVVGQDGLIPNVAKYLNGQPIVGVNPDPTTYDGVLCRHAPDSLAEILRWVEKPSGSTFRFEPRVLIAAQREDGQELLALNEVFVGHRTHQSARYRIKVGQQEERHSSSGFICSTGTGCTGWARSIALQRGLNDRLPLPMEPRLAWFVREPFPSVSTGTAMNFGVIDEKTSVTLISEMGEDGVIFGDGIESDCIEFVSGQSVELRVSNLRLKLLVRAGESPNATAAAPKAIPVNQDRRPAPPPAVASSRPSSGSAGPRPSRKPPA